VLRLEASHNLTELLNRLEPIQSLHDTIEIERNVLGRSSGDRIQFDASHAAEKRFQIRRS
jgi:hypothetical protein